MGKSSSGRVQNSLIEVDFWEMFESSLCAGMNVWKRSDQIFNFNPLFLLGDIDVT